MVRRFALMAAEQTLRIGVQIRKRRKKAGLNQRELAEALPGKADGTQVSKWERGVNRPSDHTLEAIAEVVGCEVADFYAIEPEAGPGDLMAALSPNRDAERLEKIEEKLDQLLAFALERALGDAPPPKRRRDVGSAGDADEPGETRGA